MRFNMRSLYNMSFLNNDFKDFSKKYNYLNRVCVCVFQCLNLEDVSTISICQNRARAILTYGMSLLIIMSTCY